MKGDKGGKNIFDSKPKRKPVVPPGNALLAKEAAAQKRQEAHKNPSTTPHEALRGLLDTVLPPAHPTVVLNGKRHPLTGSPVFTPATAIAGVIPSLKGSHDLAVRIAHPSRQNPPSLKQNVEGLLAGSFGFPRGGVNEHGPRVTGSGLPPVPKGHIRLYRGEGKTAPISQDDRDFYGAGNSVGGWFTDTRAVAEEYAKRNNGRLHYLDVPEGIARPWSRLRESDNGQKWTEYRFPNDMLSDLISQKKPVLGSATPPKAVIQKGPAPTVKTLGEAVTSALAGAKGVRAQEEILRSPERAARAKAFGKGLQANPTMAGAREASKHLAGEYPKVRFAGFEDFTPEAQDAMVKVITDHPMLKGGFEQKRAIGAIAKVVDGQKPTKSEEKLLRTVFGHDTTNDLMRSVSKFLRAKALGYDILNIPRSVMASYDASGIMRQGMLIGTGHPVIFARNIPAYFKAIKSEDFYHAGMEGLHSRPNAVNGVYERMGVDLTELSPRGQAASREESFRSPLAEKIPGVRMSGRGFTLYLDAARADLADHLYAKAVKNEGKLVRRIKVVDGRPRVVKTHLDPNDPHLLESIGDVVNSASGRGDLGTGVIGRSQEGLNLLLFSPRLIKSRVDFINPVWYGKLDPLARHQAYRALGGLVVLVATADKIAGSLGAKVNLDPRSSDFAKIRMGNTRIDLAAGFQQYIRLLSEIATQQVVSSSTGKVSNLGQEGPGKTSDFDVLLRFIRSKLAPITSAGFDVSQRQNAVGQPLTVGNSVVSRLTPLSGQDAVNVGQDIAKSTGSTPAGVLAGIGAFGLSSLGGGVQNYKPKPPKKKGSGNVFDGTSSGGGNVFSGGSSGSSGGNIFDTP